MSKLEDFDGMQEIADEYSDMKTCTKSDVGYHCSCYDDGKECCICEQLPKESSIKENGGHSMATTNFSQIPVDGVFEADGGNFRKVDDLYYVDLHTGFQAMWNPLFDDTIINLQAKKEEPPENEVNTTDKFLVDRQTRVMKPNPNYQKHPPCLAEQTFAEMWGTGEYDCGPEDYDYIAMVSVPAVGAMKALAELVKIDNKVELYPLIVETLTQAYELALEVMLEEKKTTVKKKSVKTPVAKKLPVKKVVKKKSVKTPVAKKLPVKKVVKTTKKVKR